jgi:hypothetical protein
MIGPGSEFSPESGLLKGFDMAGDWIKIQKDTPDKPEVLAMAARLNLDPDAVTGKLLRVWSWFDTHTTDGNASCVTFALLDRITSVTGFAEQMALVGWLSQNGHDLTLPNFDYHNGETAKKRALTKNRVDKSRAYSSNASSVTKALPEKRREEKRRDSNTVGSAKRRTQIPPDFYPNENGLDRATENGLSVAVELTKFIDFHSGKGSVMLDWQAAWRTWVGNARPSIRPTSKPMETFRERDSRLAKERADEITGRGKHSIIDANFLEIGNGT